MTQLRFFVYSLLTSLAAGLVPSLAAAQSIRIAPANPYRPQLNLGGTLTVMASPSVVSLNLTSGGMSTVSAPIGIVTKATNIGLLNSISLYAYFATTAALSAPGGATISSSNVWGASDAQPAYQSFTASSPFAANSSLLVFRTYSLLDLASGSGHQNSLTLRIDLSGVPQQPAGQYSGSLVLQAQAL